MNPLMPTRLNPAMRLFAALLLPAVPSTVQALSLQGVPADVMIPCADPVPAPPVVSAVGVCSTNEGGVLPEGLALRYAFDADQGGSVSDASGNGRDGVVTGAVWSAAGKLGGAMSFDGINDVVVGNQNPVQVAGTSNLTVSAWIRLGAFRDTTAWNANPIAVQWQSGRASWIFTVTKNRTLGFAWNDAPNTEGVTVLQTGVWYHVAARYDGAKVSLYLNGDVDREFATGFVFNASADLEIGACPYDRAWSKGEIDDLMVYTRALSSTEIASLMNGYAATFPADDPILHYRFDSEGELAKDSSPLAQHGIASGVTFVSDGVAGGAGYFDGSATIAIPGLAGVKGATSLTWGAWVRFSPEHSGLYGIMGATVALNESMYLVHDARGGSTRAYVVPQSHAEERIAEATNVVAKGVWQYLAGTYDGNTIRLYANGSLVAEETFALAQPIRSNEITFAIGDTAEGRGWRLVGAVDELRIYPRAFDATEILGLYHGEKTVSVTLRENRTGDCPGTIIRVWTATDACGSSVSATQTITVLADKTDPLTLVGVPDDVTVDCDAIPAAAKVTALGGCSGNEQAPVDGLILHYTFNNAQNIGHDSSGLNQHGDVNGVSYSSDGIEGGAASFNGTLLDQIRVNQLREVNGSTQLTWGAWVKSTSLSLQGVMGKTVAGDESFFLHVRPGLELAQAYVVPPSRAEERYAANFGTVHTAVWYHVMATYDGNLVALYINGELVQSNYYADVQPIRSNNLVFTVGDVGGGMGWAFSGLIDDVRIYRRVLGASEVAAVAAGGTAVGVVPAETSSSEVCPKVITRVWTATDACGNSASATQTITVLAADIDTDGDGLLDSEEEKLGTNPNKADTDGDGRSDGVEVDRGTNPLVFDVFPYFVRNDFDGDAISDLGVYDHTSGTWHLMRSRDGYRSAQFGYFGTTPVPGDYDGDRKADLAIYDPGNSTWYISGSAGKSTVEQWGFRGTVPVPADYDGDGRTDLAVYHSRLGVYFVNGSKRGAFYKRVFLPGGQPVVGDFDGDGRADFAVYQPSSAKWKIQLQSGGSINRTFGDTYAKGLAAEYDGDGKADLATFHAPTGWWTIQGSKMGAFKVAMPQGAGGLPVTGDYNGNNKAEAVVYLPLTAEWIFSGKSAGQVVRIQFGGPSSIPLGAGP